MKICDRAIKYMQVLFPKGLVRACTWTSAYMGEALEHSIPEIRKSERARKQWQAWLEGDYSCCGLGEDAYCPFYGHGNLNDHMIDIESVDDIPDYPEALWLAFETACNYNCTCCAFHNGGKKTLPTESPETLDRIADNLRDALPHVKEIGANGAAELFCSPRILKLLSEWKPLAPKEECCVTLETNGSLFTPENWAKIENLGQYQLSVAITVMSFHEDIYQHMSGTTLPISVIENNLKFVRSLREQGIINHLEIGSVIQAENFREMPEMAKRCLEEFGVDHFRYRPLYPGGIYDENIQWFMDVRNPHHPYFEQYMKMSEDPIFDDPRVYKWSGEQLSARGPHPGIASKRKLAAVDRLIDEPDLLMGELKGRKAAVYNMGVVGKMIASQYKDKANLIRCYSTHADMCDYQGVPVIRFSEETSGADAPDTIILAAYNNREKAKEKIRAKLGADVKIIDIWEKLDLCDCECGC